MTTRLSLSSFFWYLHPTRIIIKIRSIFEAPGKKGRLTFQEWLWPIWRRLCTLVLAQPSMEVIRSDESVEEVCEEHAGEHWESCCLYHQDYRGGDDKLVKNLWYKTGKLMFSWNMPIVHGWIYGQPLTYMVENQWWWTQLYRRYSLRLKFPRDYAFLRNPIYWLWRMLSIQDRQPDQPYLLLANLAIDGSGLGWNLDQYFEKCGILSRLVSP